MEEVRREVARHIRWRIYGASSGDKKPLPGSFPAGVSELPPNPKEGGNVPVPPVLLSAVWVGNLKEWPRALIEHFFLDFNRAFSDIPGQFDKMTKLLNSPHLPPLILSAM